MKPSNPLVKRMVQGIYSFILFWLSAGITMVFMSLLMVLKDFLKGYNIETNDLEIFIVFGVFIVLILYSLWLSKEAAIEFSENNRYFLEALYSSFKASFVFLSLIPIIGSFFSKHNQLTVSSSDSGNLIRSLDTRTRFDDLKDNK